MRAGGEEMLHEVVVLGVVLSLLGRHADHTLATTFLRPVSAHCGTLDQALVSDGNNTALVGDQVLDGNLPLFGNKLGEAWAGMLFTDGLQLGLDDREDALLAG